MEERFTRVSLNRELRANADGMPVVRECLDSEILMSFVDDDGAAKFAEWWDEEGAEKFQAWLNCERGESHEGKFKRLAFMDELKLLTDGMPTFRRCFEHEIMTAFFFNEDAEGFREWWDKDASLEFQQWIDSEKTPA